MKYILAWTSLMACFILNAQVPNYWQQKVDYQMDIDVDESKYRYEGKMKLIYTNNSPDSLDKVYFHLYFNAFQPGSAMDYRLVHVADPDSRMTVNQGTAENPDVKSRIALLKPDEIGYQKIRSVKHDGKKVDTKVRGTLLEVTLDKPVAPNSTSTFELEWDAQVPVLIRRGGRNSMEGIDFSMTQWYPKMAEYDRFGWHLDEYIGREFHAPFGNFDVKIHIQKDYVIGSSGVLQNPGEVKGYVPNPQIKTTKDKATWHFKAENIHDFAWGADKDYVVEQKQVPNGPKLYFVYQPGEKSTDSWKNVQDDTVKFFEFMNAYFGKYPWPAYSIIHGGDGGMEYGTSTLVTGNRNLEGLRGVIFHEGAHSWFQHLLATNETVDEWMDEGFTSYADKLAHNAIIDKVHPANPNPEAVEGYRYLANSGVEEPMSLLADYYDYNQVYGLSAYYKGQVLAIQLGYIIGEENLKKTFQTYFDLWKFKHSTPEDFQKVAQDVSGINLKWFFNLFVNTTRKIDYGIFTISGNEINLQNFSNFPMPIDLLVEYEDGSKELFYIPALEMRAEKPAEDLDIYKGIKRTVLEDWIWTNPYYTVKTSKKVKKAAIDPSTRLADTDLSNNQYTVN